MTGRAKRKFTTAAVVGIAIAAIASTAIVTQLSSGGAAESQQRFVWQNVHAAGPIDATEDNPFTSRQVKSPDRVVAVRGNMFTGPDRYHALFKTYQGDQPGSTSGYRTEVAFGTNTNPTLPKNETWFHGIGFVLRKWPSDTHLNVHQMYGAGGHQPAFQVKTQSGNLMPRVNSSGTSAREATIAKTSAVAGKYVRIAYQLKPSRSSSDFVKVWLSVGTEPWRQVWSATGPIGAGVDPYPRLGGYGGSAGRTNFPWTTEHHGFFFKYPSLASVQEAMRLYDDGSPPPPPPPPPPPGEAPVACFTIAPAQPHNGGEVTTFNGACSTDDVGVVKWEWDIVHTPPGEYEREGNPITFPFVGTGNKTVTLRVTDGDGRTATLARIFPVTTPPAAP